MSQQFGPSLRLRQRSEFTAVQNGGLRVAGRFITVLGRPNGLESDRLGIVASRRVGAAVARNRAKRRVRELFRRSRPSPRAGRQFDIVVIVRSELPDAPFEAVAADFQTALTKLRGAR